MPPRLLDPARLKGEALANWYRRSPADVEQERQDTATQQYENFFGRREEGAGTEPQYAAEQTVQDQPSLVVQGVYRPGDEGEFTQVGNPHNPQLRREWEIKNGPWPRDPKTGRNYDVGHRKAIADGGTNTLDNIDPIHPDDHRAQHQSNGDHSRWGKRAGIARAFGGTVARALGPLNLFSTFTGMLSGRIRTDNFDNFTSDVMGFPSQEDYQRYLREHQREWNPGWKPGDPLIDPRQVA